MAMDYCKFENTCGDLSLCVGDINNADWGEKSLSDFLDELNEYERPSVRRMYNLCKEFVEAYENLAERQGMNESLGRNKIMTIKEMADAFIGYPRGNDDSVITTACRNAYERGAKDMMYKACDYLYRELLIHYEDNHALAEKNVKQFNKSMEE